MQPIKPEWREVAGYEGLYWVSDAGQVATMRRQGTTGAPLKPILQKHGYLTVMLSKDGRTHKEYVHRLVANTFLGKHPGMVVNHKDECKTNNHLSNLEWITNEQNLAYGHAMYNDAVARRYRNAKVLVQLDMSGKEVATYMFLKDAAKAVNGAAINISRAARHVRNRVTAYGYKWRYE